MLNCGDVESRWPVVLNMSSSPRLGNSGAGETGVTLAGRN